jgi:hypothetical protein
MQSSISTYTPDLCIRDNTLGSFPEIKGQGLECSINSLDVHDLHLHRGPHLRQHKKSIIDSANDKL